MSKQAFAHLMEQLSDDDRTKVYALAATYEIKLDDPMWVPFALTQASLIAVKNAIAEMHQASAATVDLGVQKINRAADDQADNLRQKSEDMATVIRKAVLDAGVAERTAIAKASQQAGAALVAQVLNGVKEQVGEVAKAGITPSIKAGHDTIKATNDAVNKLQDAVRIDLWSRFTNTAVGALIGVLVGGAGLFLVMKSGWLSPQLSVADQRALDGGRKFQSVYPRLDIATQQKIKEALAKADRSAE